MDHVAIMKKSWGLTDKILRGEKTIETRWYKNKYPPYDQIKVWESVYFKDAGCPVTVKAKVIKVEQFDDLDAKRSKEIVKKYSHADLGTSDIKQEILEYVKGKSYCVIVHLGNPEAVTPFNIDKTWYGAMASWICVDDVERIKKT